jgi:hypothetical protein
MKRFLRSRFLLLIPLLVLLIGCVLFSVTRPGLLPCAGIVMFSVMIAAVLYQFCVVGSGDLLFRRTAAFKLTESQHIEFTLRKTVRKIKVLIFFCRNTGFYNGDCTLVSRDTLLGRATLPRIPQFLGSRFRIYNRAIPRSPEFLAIRADIPEGEAERPFRLSLELQPNVTDASLRRHWKVDTDEDMVEVCIREQQ